MSAIKKSALISDRNPKKSVIQASTKAKGKVSFKSAEFVKGSDGSSDSEEQGISSHTQTKSQQPHQSFVASKPILPNGTSVRSQKGVKRETSSSESERTDSSSREDEESDLLGNINTLYKSSSSQKETSTRKPHKPTLSANPSAIKPRSASKAKDSIGVKKTSSKPRSKSSDTEEEESSNSSTSGEPAGQTRSKHGDSRESGRSDGLEVISAEKTTNSSSTLAGGNASSPKVDSIMLPYEPPPHVKPATISFSSSQVEDMFALSNLDGKQLWHITAPSSIPLSSVKEVSSKSILNGLALLSHEGADYGMVTTGEGVAGVEKALLIPSANSNDYRSSTATIEKSLQLQQLIKLPIRIIDPRASASDTVKSPPKISKPRNQQPQGLKMRYHAFGLPSVGASDSESESHDLMRNKMPSLPQFIHPDISKPSKKRKHSELTNSVVTPPLTASELEKKSKAASDPLEGLYHENKPQILSQLPSAKQSISINDIGPSHIKKKEVNKERAKRKEEKHQKKLLQPFQVPRSVPPAKALLEENSKRNVQANGAISDGEDDDGEGADKEEQATAGASLVKGRNGVMFKEDEEAVEVEDEDAAMDYDRSAEDGFANQTSHVLDQENTSPVKKETPEERRKRGEERKEEKRLRRESRAARVAR